MRLVLAAGALGAALLFVAPSAHACSCAPPPDATAAFGGSKFVFTATAGATTQAPADDEGAMANFQPKSVAFTVLDSYKGGLGGNVTLKTAGNSAACGRSYKEGETYLVYATKNEAGEPFDTICTRTRPLKGNEADIAVLEGLKAETPEPPEKTAGDDEGEAATGEAATGEAATGEAATGEAATGEATTPPPGEAGEAGGDTQAGETAGEATADSAEAQATDAPTEGAETTAGSDSSTESPEGAADEPKSCSTADTTPSWTLLALLPLVGRVRRR